ncbi:tRNA (guanosine(37)-N1)-methyltransferase TrmD [bacterium]|nr:tRNA (guanosine(37)-N1)-methyltransferase TrmD [bacterium]
MDLYILTLFPHYFDPFLENSILGTAIQKKLLNIHLMNFRDFSLDKHSKVDDLPYGGGSGMVLQVEPLWRAYQAIPKPVRENATVILPSPRGVLFKQEKAMALSKEPNLIFICGQYKGIDQRVQKLLGAQEISIGDYVLTGGELPALILLNAIARFVPGVLGDLDSALSDSFTSSPDLLGAPAYSRPVEFQGLTVPPVLLSGNHQEIQKWRETQALITTLKNRPDLLQNSDLTPTQKKLLKDFKGDQEPSPS